MQSLIATNDMMKDAWLKAKKEAVEVQHKWKSDISEADLSEEKLYLFVREADVLQHPSQVELLNWKFPKKKKKLVI